MFLKVCEPLDKLIHSLIVFEEDALNLTDYTNKLLQTMQRVFGAQSEMGLATEQLAQQLLDYEKKNFALGKGDEEVITTLQSFAKTVGELNSLHSALANQMADNMVFPLIQFREKDLTEISTLKEIHGIATDEHEAAMVKYSRLPKKRENEKMKTDMVKEVAYTRRKQHQASLQYYCALNALQYRKRVAMLEPMLGYTQAQVLPRPFGLIKKMDNFLSSVSKMTQSIQTQLDSEAEAMRSTQRELLSVDDSIYTPDSNAVSVNRTLIQKAGYLNIRNKTGLVTTAWDRLYFFTQGGNLMCQPRGAVAGGMVLDLDNSSVMAIECEDRRYCFQITSSTGKTSMILQAESKKEYEEWICTVNNISRQIYLTDNPEVSSTWFTSHNALNNGDFQGSQKSAPEPEDLIAPGTPIQFDITLPASEFMDQNRGGRRTNPFGETDDECLAESDDSLLQQVFAVRFLGSMAVRCGNNQEVIYEAMRQVLAARAIHNIFKTTESHLMVTSNDIRLIDPQTQVNKITVREPAAHGVRGAGPRLGRGEEAGQTAFSAYIFESNTEGEKVCYTINLAKDITEAKKDPEALAQLMKNMPFTNDGKFLLLESETGEEPDGASQEDLESEA
uniref:Adaptor protein, phosphotyrosine interaction, PH domain and leucine zipper containing 2 n=1 Tax=Neogobius melanostomus TaxID=47308 RepID=A0A8C6TYQ5_9GOBI